MDGFRNRICSVCEIDVEYHELSQCTTCRGSKDSESLFFCRRYCHDTNCRTRNCSRHPSCWNVHIPNYEAARSQHQLVDPLPDLFVKAVTYSEPNKEKQRKLHEDDQVARWFTIKPDYAGDGPARLCISDRFRELCNPGFTDNRWSLNQYPSFASFIGETCVGKSTILRAMLLMGQVHASRILCRSEQTTEEEKIYGLKAILAATGRGPVTRGVDLVHLTDPTSLGVHLYKDAPGATQILNSSSYSPGRTTPILFADCEGFRAGLATAGAERLSTETKGRPEIRGRGSFQTDSRFRALSVGSTSSSHRRGDNLISDMPITAPGIGRRGKEGAELFYARFLYTISDVVVFVMKNDTTLQLEMQHLLEWAASAVYKSVNQRAQKTLIIVRNMAGLHDKELYSPEVLKSSLLDHMNNFWEGSQVLKTFRDEHNQKHTIWGEQIHHNNDFLEIFFKSVNVCYIPDKAKAETTDIFKQYLELRNQIDHASLEGQNSRSKAWMQYNVPALSHVLERAFDHFRTSDSPFNFYKAARNDNPNPTSMSEHIANFLRHLYELPEKPPKISQRLSQAISTSLVSWALRTFKDQVYEPEFMLRNELRESCRKGLLIFKDKYEACEFEFDGGSRCIQRGRQGHVQHCDANGNRQPGVFTHSFDQRGETLEDIEREFISLYRHLCTQSGASPSLPTTEQSSYVRENVLAKAKEIWMVVKSNKTCFTCLQEVPDHVLTCGHGYCSRCITEFGKESDSFEYGWVMDHCILCQEFWYEDRRQLVRLQPKCAGVRILTLDGGGIRGVIELALLEQVESRINQKFGLKIPFRDFFDLIVGTSTGGIIALGLATLEDLKMPAMKEIFINLASDTFKKRREGSLLGRIDSAQILSKACLLLRIWDSIYPTTPLKNNLINVLGKDVNLFSSAPITKRQRSTRVAITSVKDKAASFCLIANYNRPSQSAADDFEREDEDSKEIKVWEAGLATAAAPFYFRPYEKSETKKDYVDGALHANFPVRYALEEMNKIWAGTSGARPLDILLTVGTGIQEKKIEIPSVLRIGGFDKICMSFHKNLDSESQWLKFKEEMKSQYGLSQDRIQRLNIHVQGEYVALNEYKKMSDLDRMVQNQMKTRNGRVSSLGQQIESLADVLVANLFFFEPDEVSRTDSYLHATNAPGPHHISGSIRCRLASNSPGLKDLVNKLECFWQTEILCGENMASLETVWTQILYLDEQRKAVRSDRMRFQLKVSIATFEPNDVQQVIAISFRGEVVQKRSPISGFPVSLKELRRRAKDALAF